MIYMKKQPGSLNDYLTLCAYKPIPAHLLMYLHRRDIMFQTQIDPKYGNTQKRPRFLHIGTDILKNGPNILKIGREQFVKTLLKLQTWQYLSLLEFPCYPEMDVVQFELNFIKMESILLGRTSGIDTRKEAKRVGYHVMCAERLGLPATLTFEQWICTLKYFNQKCAYCSGGDYEIFEHYIPLLHGGGTTWDNCVPACPRCNARKLDLYPDQFRERLGEGAGRVAQYLQQRREEILSV